MKPGSKVRAVFLIGFMGAGKTSVGRELAHLLSWQFIDLDDRIVAREQRSIAEIFRDSSEERFRQLESEALGDLLGELSAADTQDEHRPAAGESSGAGNSGRGRLASTTSIVVALGGGAFCREENQRR